MMRPLLLALLVGTAPFLTYQTVSASTQILCPNIAQVKQVGDCPPEEEVKRMFKATCDFERDPNATNPDKCDSYAEFKRRKFHALWESSDGQFMSYASCAATPADIRTTKLTGVAVSQTNGLYKISCNYEGGSSFIMRTRSVCRIPGVKTSMITIRAKCDGDPASCAVICD